MTIEHVDTLSVCVDCFTVALADDLSSFDYYYGSDADKRISECEAAWLKFPGQKHMTDMETDDFSRSACECCGTRLAGQREYVAIYQTIEG